jgi:integrase
LLGGIFTFAIKQGYISKDTINPVTSAETATVPDFDGLLSVLPEPSQTVVALAAFTGLRARKVRGLTWEAYTPGDENSLGVIRVLRSVWRGRVGEPKNSRLKAPVPLIPQLEALLERHREASGDPVSGPIFPNGAGKPFDLDSLYRRQMKERPKTAWIEWEGWHGFRRPCNKPRAHWRERIHRCDGTSSLQ